LHEWFAMKHLHETNPLRFMLLEMKGELLDMMFRLDEEANERVIALSQQLLEKDPLPITDDIFEKTRYYNKHKDIVEEMVINELVLVPR